MLNDMPETRHSVRLDSWLWAARFYKTRTLAAEAVDGGKIDLNGDRPKRSKAVKVGDEIALKQGPYQYRLHVTGLADADRSEREDRIPQETRHAFSIDVRPQGKVALFNYKHEDTKARRHEGAFVP